MTISKKNHHDYHYPCHRHHHLHYHHHPHRCLCSHHCLHRMSRQPSHQSVNEDTVPYAHPYSHIPGLTISKAEAVKVTKLILSLTFSSALLYSTLLCSTLLCSLLLKSLSYHFSSLLLFYLFFLSFYFSSLFFLFCFLFALTLSF